MTEHPRSAQTSHNICAVGSELSMADWRIQNHVILYVVFLNDCSQNWEMTNIYGIWVFPVWMCLYALAYIIRFWAIGPKYGLIDWADLCCLSVHNFKQE